MMLFSQRLKWVNKYKKYLESIKEEVDSLKKKGHRIDHAWTMLVFLEKEGLIREDKI